MPFFEKITKRWQVYFLILYLHCCLINSINSIEKDLKTTVTSASDQNTCGDYLTALKGSIHTPSFPNPFLVPIKCRWIIDASDVFSTNNHSIIIYLTQVYVYKGLKFTEYAYYESENTNFGGTLIQKITEGNIFKHRKLQTNRPFLVVEFELERLEGNHVRVLDHFLYVYGFNITYEITADDDSVDINSCSIQDCSFNGNCILGAKYRKFSCECFDNFYGEKCSNGPFCFDDNNTPICKNEGICNHIGSTAMICQCKSNFIGHYCEIPIKNEKLMQDQCQDENRDDDDDYDVGGCIYQCPVLTETNNYKPCDCVEPILIYNDRARYECHIKLSNGTLFRSSLTSSTSVQLSSTWETLLKKQLIKYLRNFDIIKMEDFKITNVTSSAEVIFHFYGLSSEGDRIRDALNRLVQRRRLNDFTLESTHFTFQQNPLLKLQSLNVMNYINERDVRLNDELILSCIAQGSSDINFLWYKDDMLVNTSKSIRKMSIENTVSNDGLTFISFLKINKATLLDKGQYTCQIIDSGMQQCKQIYINIRDEPNVKILPMSVTVEKSSNIQLTCITPNMNSLGIGFGWTKNRALLKLDPNNHVWEDLYPAGSILKIINIQKSAIFTCNVAHRSMSVRVDVINRTLIPICTSEKAWNLYWPDTGPGSEAFLECPRQFVGNKISRLCMMENSTTAMWQIPDFSECLYKSFTFPYSIFQSLTLGFQNITGLYPNTFIIFWEILQQRQMPLYPGEGDRLLRILAEIEHYYRNTINEPIELYNSADSFMFIVNRILDDDNSIIRHYNRLLLQQLILRNLQYWIKKLLIKSNSDNQNNHLQYHLALSSMVIDIQPFRWSGYNLDGPDIHDNNHQFLTFDIPIDDYIYPHWYNNNEITVKLFKRNDLHVNIDTSMIGAVVLFKNMTRFLPHTYVKELKDGTDFEYHFYSKIVTVAIFPSNDITNTNTQVELTIHHLQQNRSALWNISCGMEDPFSGNWDLDACITMLLPNQMSTLCTCPSPGTFALFLTARAIRVSLATNCRTSTFIVLLGCTCGLLQSVISIFFLSYTFWKHRNWLNFLKLQFSIALIGVMIFFIYATYFTELSEDSFAIIAVSLETLFSIGMSAPISQALIVYAELMQIRPNSQHFQPTIIAIITGLPILCILTTELSHQSTGNQHETWWLKFGSGGYNNFISCVITMILIFIVLYTGILRKIRINSNKNSIIMKKQLLEQNVCVVHRAIAILCVFIFTMISSIFYINSNDEIYHYIFASLSAFLGFINLFMNVGNREMISIINAVFCQFNWKNMIKKDLITSDSIKVCTKISTDFDNENAAPIIPLTNVGIRNAPILCKSTDACGINAHNATLQTNCSGGSVSTVNMRKYINPSLPEKSIIKSSTSHTASCYYPEKSNNASNNQSYALDDINLETYSTSPRKYQEFNNINTFPNENPVPLYLVPEYHASSRTKVFSTSEISSTKVLRCSADIESRINNAVAMPDITLATAATDTGHNISNTVEVIHRERANVIPDIASSISECKKPDYHQHSNNKQPNEDISDNEQNTNGMLDRISHDLDYLLNRTQQNKNDE
ncbi:uncharacterized protein [Chelonus insularis]|uniref:uncharacterized protein n=1 Tax=Chelonus insularis TaxID=460826 RepID=UPI00158A0690|nr:uncharacterized protein LOC118064369 [Chelonus insularis]